MEEPSTPSTVTAFPLVRPDDGEVAGLVAVIRRLAAARSLPEIMATVTHAARTLLHADGVTFVLREADLCYYAEEDAISPLWKGRRFAARSCISGWCMEHASAVVIADITKDARIPQDAYRPTFVKSLAMVPIAQEEPLGALGAYWASEHEATADELELLQTVANAAALGTALVQVKDQKSIGRRLHRLATSCSDRLQEISTAPSERSASESPDWTDNGKAALIGIGFAAAAYVARWGLGGLLDNEVPFATFYLAVAGAALWGGVLGGTAAAIVGGLLAQFSFVEPVGLITLKGSKGWALLTFWIVDGVLIYAIQRLMVAQSRTRALNAKLELIGEELQHRFKNFIAVTEALALQTSRTSSDHAEFRKKFSGRLQALGSAQSLLKQVDHSAVGLAELLETTLEPFRFGEQLAIGPLPDVPLRQDAATGLALVLNELATNALKHGALSTPDGHVIIHAQIEAESVILQWEEQGGPSVSAPRRESFGTRLIRSAIPHGLGSTKTEYRPEGLACRIEVSLADALD